MGSAQLAQHQDVEFGAERGGNLDTDGQPAPRDRQDDQPPGLRNRWQSPQRRREALSGLNTIRKHPHAL